MNVYELVGEIVADLGRCARYKKVAMTFKDDKFIIIAETSLFRKQLIVPTSFVPTLQNMSQFSGAKDFFEMRSCNLSGKKAG